MPDCQIRILCVDDHAIVREGLALIIGRQPDMRVVACASNGEDAVEQYDVHRPDVTLMDLQLGSMSGVEAIRAIRIKDPNARIVVLTVFQGDDDIQRAMQAGATTYLLKDTLSHDLVRVIRDVNAGALAHFSPDIKARLDEFATHSSLTRREREVLDLMGKGLRNKEISAALGISQETAQVHVRNILAKLDVKDRTAAVAVAVRRGILHLT